MYEDRSDPWKSEALIYVTAEQKTDSYGAVYDSAVWSSLPAGMWHRFDTWPPLVWTPPSRKTSRSGSNLNIGLFKALRAKRRYTFEKVEVYSPYGIKVRRWDFKKGKYVNGRKPGLCTRIKRKFEKIDKSKLTNLKDNTLFLFQRNTPVIYGIFDAYRIDTYQIDGVPVDLRVDAKIVGDPVHIVRVSSNFANVFHQILGFSYPLTVRQSDFFGDYTTELSDVRDVSLRQLYSKVKDQKADIATGLAEISQTASLLGEAVHKIASLILDIRKGKIGDAIKGVLPKTSKDISNARLAYTYGVEPLISDTKGVAEYIAQFVSEAPKMKVSAKASRVIKYPETMVHVTLSNGSVVEVYTTKTVKVRTKHTLNFSVSDEFKNYLSRMGFTSPVNVAWELVPFSFVADWFLPIGNFLGGLSAFDGLQLKSCTLSESLEETISKRFSWSESNSEAIIANGWKLKDCIIEVPSRSFCVRRTEVPLNTLSLPTPRFKNPFSSAHIANALALLDQKIFK